MDISSPCVNRRLLQYAPTLFLLLVALLPVVIDCRVYAGGTGGYVPPERKPYPLGHALQMWLLAVPETPELQVRVLNRSPRNFLLDVKTIHPQRMANSASRFFPKSIQSLPLPVATMDQIFNGKARGAPITEHDWLRNNISSTGEDYDLPNNPMILMPQAYVGMRFPLPSEHISYFDKLVAFTLSSTQAECWGLHFSTAVMESNSMMGPIPSPSKDDLLISNYVYFSHDLAMHFKERLDAKEGHACTEGVMAHEHPAAKKVIRISYRDTTGKFATLEGTFEELRANKSLSPDLQRSIDASWKKMTASSRKIESQAPPFSAQLVVEPENQRLWVDVVCERDVPVYMAYKTGCAVPTFDNTPRLHMKTVDLRDWVWSVTANGKTVTKMKFAEPVKQEKNDVLPWTVEKEVGAAVTTTGCVTIDRGAPAKQYLWPTKDEYLKMPSPALLYGQLAGRVIKIDEAPFFTVLREFHDAAPNDGKATATLSVEIPLFMPDKDNNPVASGTLTASIPISRDDVGRCLASTTKWIAVPVPKDMIPVTGTSMSSKPTAAP